MVGTAIINPGRYNIRKLVFRFNNQPISLSDISEINIELIENNKIQFLIIGIKGEASNSLILLIQQCKLCFPHLVVILIIDRVKVLKTIEYFKSGIDHIIPFCGSYEKLQQNINSTFDLYENKSINTFQIISYKDLVVDPNTRKVMRSGREIKLARKEFDLLEFLAMHIGIPFSRSIILEAVWGYNCDVFSNTIDVHFSNLRRKLDNLYPIKLLHTVHGMGYKLEAV